MDKVIEQDINVRDRILSGIDRIVDPVSSTLGPKGSNVVFENEVGVYTLTNDGITVAKNVSSSDRIEQAMIDVIKATALRTNSEGGDGTTTTCTLNGVLAKEALKLKDDGYSWIEIRDTLNALRDKLIKQLEKSKKLVEGKKGLKEIANISANNDSEIAENVVKAIDIAGLDGMVFLEPNNKQTTELKEDVGFMVHGGILYQELTNQGNNTVSYNDVPVLLTDKKLYYPEEAETILREAIKAKYKAVVVVARDFMGDAVNTFIANHTKGVINVMLVKIDVDEKNNDKLQDLATYLGGKIVSEKTGSLVNKITANDFVVINRAFSGPAKTLFTPKVSATKELKERISMLKDELAKDKDNEMLKQRIASLTTGIVTIKVGGFTPIEVNEKLYRYEDAVNATRSAIRDGYLVGGGLSLFRAFNEKDCPNKAFLPLYRKFCEAILRKIASNAGQHEDSIVMGIKLSSSYNEGYNARENRFEDLLKAGIIDPFMVIKLAVEGAFATANTIVSVKYYMTNKKEDDKD